MLYVSTSEVFDNTYPGTIQDRQEIVNTTADRETIKKVIGENVYIQAALVKETDFVIESVRRDKKLKPERCGTNCMFFLDDDEGRLLSDLSAVYRRLKPVTDNEGNLIGYQSSATSPVAIELVKEMAEEGELDDLISHFMLPGETVNTPQRGTFAARIEGGEADKEYMDRWTSGEYYKVLVNHKNRAGAGVIGSNQSRSKDIEKDPYIQALIALGHEVYVCGYDEDTSHRIVIK